MQTVDRFQVAFGIIVANQRRGLFVIFHQADFDALFVVVCAGFLACSDSLGRAVDDPFDQSVVIDLKLNHRIKLHPVAGEKLVESVSLRQSARETVEDETGVVAVFEFLFDQADHDLVGDEFARIHHGGDFLAHLRAGSPCRTQHITSGKLHHATLLHEALRLSSLARARRSKQNNIHRLAVPLLLRFLPRS